MRCLDDCHNYVLDSVLGQPIAEYGKDQDFDAPYTLSFYEMRSDGTKVDGVTNEEVIRVLIHRLRYLNAGKFLCRENSLAVTRLEEALMWLNKRTEDRKARGVEGTHEVKE